MIDRYELPLHHALRHRSGPWRRRLDVVVRCHGLLAVASRQRRAGGRQLAGAPRPQIPLHRRARPKCSESAFWKGQYGLSTFDQNVVAEYTPATEEAMWRLKTGPQARLRFRQQLRGILPEHPQSQVNGEQQVLADHASVRTTRCSRRHLIYDRAGWCPGAPTTGTWS